MMPQFSSDGIDKNQKLLSLLAEMAYKKHATPVQISLAWMLCKKPYLVPIPGTRKEERLKENADAASIILTEQVQVLLVMPFVLPFLQSILLLDKNK